MYEHSSTVVIATGAVLLLVLWILWWRFPDWMAKRRLSRSDKNHADVEDAYRKAITQAIGGMALIAALYFTALQYQIASDTEKLATDAAKLATEAANRATHSQAIDQYQKGFDALKGEDVAVHVGGVYGLEILISEQPQFRAQVLKGLSSAAVAFSLAKPRTGPIRSDAHAALQVAVNYASAGNIQLPLGGAKFAGAKIPRANLEGSDLSNTDLSGSDISGSNSQNGLGSNLRFVNLTSANLNGANLGSIDFSYARLVGARINEGANFATPNLQRLTATGAQLASSNFTNADLTDAQLHYANLQGVVFSNTTMIRAQLDFSCLDKNTKFQRTDLSDSTFRYAWINGVVFGSGERPGFANSIPSTNLSGARFDHANLTNSTFLDVNLRGTSFFEANLTGVRFAKGSINEASLRGAFFCNTLMPDNKKRSESCGKVWIYPKIKAMSCENQLSRTLGSGGIVLAH